MVDILNLLPIEVTTVFSGDTSPTTESTFIKKSWTAFTAAYFDYLTKRLHEDPKQIGFVWQFGSHWLIVERKVLIEQKHFLSSSESNNKKKGMRKKATITAGTRDGENILATVWYAKQEYKYHLHKPVHPASPYAWKRWTAHQNYQKYT